MMRPIIGVVLRPYEEENKFCMNNNIRKMINRLEGIPIGITPSNYTTIYNQNYESRNDVNENMEDILKICDGIILQGGNDFYEYDKQVLSYCIKENVPVLGICLGMQLMGSLYDNNLVRVSNHKLIENKKHNVNININSKFYSIINKTNILVNSRHEEALFDSGIYDVAGMSDDGVIEAIEYNQNNFNIGLQWHIEDMNDDSSVKILEYFMKETLKYKVKKDFDKKI